MWPASRSGSQRAFCAGVAYSAKVRIGPKLPNCTTSALRGHTERDLLDGDHRVHQRAALAAIGFRQRDAHEALRGHQLRHVEREMRVVRALERILLQMRKREAAHRVREQLLLFGKIEVHGVQPLFAVIAGLDPAIHWAISEAKTLHGCPGQARA